MAGKRPYKLGKRQASVDETKRRILEAATAEYTDRGIEETSMQAVARRADVAPGTVLYHYPTPEELADAVIEMWVNDMKMPTPDAVDPDAPLEARIRSMVTEVFGLFDRSEAAYQIYRHSPDHPSMEKGRVMWEGAVAGMMANALGDRMADPQVIQVVSVLIDPGFRGTLVSRGMDNAAATEAATKLILAWLET
jgi:AcrR family transcriptional regulator